MTQKKENVSRIMVVPEMDREVAIKRYERFNLIKLPVIKGIPKCANQESEIPYFSAPFLALLKLVADSNSGFTGLRIYFACYVKSTSGTPSENSEADRERIPAGKEGCLTLVFVPTEEIAGNDLTDSGQYYIFKADGSDTIKITDYYEIKDWIDEYKKSEPGGIRFELNKSIGGDRETKSIWYSKKTVADTYKDILTYHHSATYITAFFGAYEANASEYLDYGDFNNGMRNVHPNDQLTLIFGTGAVPFTQTTRSEPADYDTGAPCPPAPGCEGSGFYP